MKHIKVAVAVLTVILGLCTACSSMKTTVTYVSESEPVTQAAVSKVTTTRPTTTSTKRTKVKTTTATPTTTPTTTVFHSRFTTVKGYPTESTLGHGNSGKTDVPGVVTVKMQKWASSPFKKDAYTAADFPELELESVYQPHSYDCNTMEEAERLMWEKDGIAPKDFRVYLELTLCDKSEEAVLAAILKLADRPDVYYVNVQILRGVA